MEKTPTVPALPGVFAEYPVEGQTQAAHARIFDFTTRDDRPVTDALCRKAMRILKYQGPWSEQRNRLLHVIVVRSGHRLWGATMHERQWVIKQKVNGEWPIFTYDGESIYDDCELSWLHTIITPHDRETRMEVFLEALNAFERQKPGDFYISPTISWHNNHMAFVAR